MPRSYELDPLPRSSRVAAGGELDDEVHPHLRGSAEEIQRRAPLPRRNAAG
jgi:hypothetical protein